MADQKSAAGISRSDFSVRSIHTSKSDATAGKARIHSILYVFRLEEYQMGANPVFHRADADTGAGIYATERLAKHSRHPYRVSAVRRPPGVYGTPCLGSHSQRELRDLRSGFRAVRGPGAAPGQRGVFGFREVSDTSVGH